MGSKRNYNAVFANDNDGPSHPSSKRRRDQQSTKSKHAENKPDPTYGQRAAFPGLDDDDAQLTDDDLEFEEHGDALAYLRSVRQEASTVPNVLVAPKAGPQLPLHLQTTNDDTAIDRSLYDNGVGDSRGYYQDGAYTAVPDPDPSIASSPEEGEEEDEEGEYRPGTPPDSSTNPDVIARNSAALRKAYYASLTAQFLRLRALLHRAPPPDLVASLPRENGTEVGSFGARSWTFRVWTKRIRHTDPLPAQVAALDRQSVLKLLRVILGGKFIRRGYELRERTSRWLWALLARLPDRGELDYTEVGWVRELGKRAVLMMVSIAQMAALREEVGEGVIDDGGEGEEEDDEEEDGEYIGEIAVDDDEVEEGSGGASGETGLKSRDDEAGPPAGASAISKPAADVPVVDEDGNGEMDMDLDDGEISDEPTAAKGNQDIEAEIAAAKARLLARLAEPTDTEQNEQAATAVEPGADEQEEENGEEQTAFDETRARVNMRATLNMILTVAGEFYGQRDLLEFRDPFPAL
ncbi:hypothetical protein MMYC01_206513 [Madurella mycetomatis]|uniref:Uncharacterized protein n=1 Tax=Madurella mycetomatis TaxID=100816 RepID=A0A175VZJ5_9PEZI|nr:hypothetical protein MMYC01_206513 [Madurella mycetomatis]